MSTTHDASTWHCEGSVALSADAQDRGLFVIEGGRAAAPVAQELGVARPRRARGVGSKECLVAGLATLAVLLVLCAASVASDALDAARVSTALAGAQTQVVVVLPGDTLWGIASACATDEVGVTDVMSWIEEANGIDGSQALGVGQRLVVPVLE